MGEASSWHDAFSTALKEQAILIAGLIRRLQRQDSALETLQRVVEDAHSRTESLERTSELLREKLHENTNRAARGQDVIHGITGAKYVPLVFERPSGFSEETNPAGSTQQTEPT